MIENDLVINRMEVELDEECLKVLALHQPVALDDMADKAWAMIHGSLDALVRMDAGLARKIGMLDGETRKEYLELHVSFRRNVKTQRQESVHL